MGRTGWLAGSDRRRNRIRLASSCLLAVGVAAVALGILAPRWSADPEPQPVGAAGQVTPLPEAGWFGGEVALYGQLRTDRLPTADELGCVVSPQARGPVRPDRGGQLERLVIDGVAVTGLAVVPESGSGSALTCAGARVADLQPMYAVARPGVDAMVPMAAYSLASLAVVGGGCGLLLVRAEVGRA